MDWESVTPKIPKLLRCYLSLGAKICGRPFMDESLGTIDFLTLLDLKGLSKISSTAFWGQKSSMETPFIRISDNRKGTLRVTHLARPSLIRFLAVGCRQSFK